MTEVELQAAPEQIKSFWDDRAHAYGTSATATLPERAMHALEISAIERQLGDGLRIADVGCGNGYATIHHARRFKSEFYGYDYSEPMIDYANKALRTTPARQLKGHVHFDVADMVRMPCESDRFDRVITERAVQNLTSWALQAQAIAELLRITKPGGHLIMAECSQTGVEQLNRWRSKVGRVVLDDIVPWHNLFLRDELMLGLKNELPIKRIDIKHYSSTFTFVTRILPFWRPLYYQEVLPRLLPNVGRFGYFKLYLIEKEQLGK